MADGHRTTSCKSSQSSGKLLCKHQEDPELEEAGNVSHTRLSHEAYPESRNPYGRSVLRWLRLPPVPDSAKALGVHLDLPEWKGNRKVLLETVRTSWCSNEGQPVCVHGDKRHRIGKAHPVPVDLGRHSEGRTTAICGGASLDCRGSELS